MNHELSAIDLRQAIDRLWQARIILKPLPGCESYAASIDELISDISTELKTLNRIKDTK